VKAADSVETITSWGVYAKYVAKGAEEGQEIAESAVMLAAILALVVGTVRLIGSNANNAISSFASSLARPWFLAALYECRTPNV